MEEKKETKMDISSILSTLGIADDDADDITRNSDEYQAYLDSPLSVDVVYPIVDSIILLDTLSHILEATPQSLSSLNIKKIAVCALSTAINSNDSNAVSLSCRLLLALSTLPSSSGSSGVNSTSVSSTLANAVLKIAISEIKIPVKKAVAKAKKHDDDDEDEVEEEVPATQPSLTQELFGSAEASSKSLHRQVNKVRITPSNLLLLTKDIKSNIHLFWQRSEDYPIECCLDALSAVLFLSSINPAFTQCYEESMGALVTLGTVSKRGMVAFYRCLMPILTMVPRDHRIIDSTKCRTTMHKSAIQAVLKVFHTLNLDWLSDDYETSDVSISSTKQASVTSFPFICMLGALQRMTVTVTDRAPIRATMLTSIISIVSAIHVVHEGDKSINHYLLFLAKLAKSNKVSHRAFGLEIATSILSFDWIWALQSCNAASATTGASTYTEATSPMASPCKDVSMSVSPTNTTPKACIAGAASPAIAANSYEAIGPKILLDLIVSRCDDTAPTVRSRAIGAVCDLLENINDQSNIEYCEYMLQLMLGIGSINLLEILRTRALDDKALVRVKAVQAYGIALSNRWSKRAYDHDVCDVVVNYIHVHISEEDLQVFSDACNDVSVAVRKQALSSLTTLLLSRSEEEIIHDAWVLAVLPMATDAESSVQAKYAQKAYELLLEPLSMTVSNRETAPIVSPTWSICMKTIAAGRGKLLRSTVGLMFRLNLIQAPQLKNVMKAIKRGCVYSLEQSSANGVRDASMITAGAWALLESFMGHDSTSSDTQTTILAAFGKDSESTDFVVRCFREKRAAVSTTTDALDAEDQRMLTVMGKVAHTLSGADVVYVKKELLSFLSSMRCAPAGISACVSVLYSLSKLQPSLQADVELWSEKLLELSHNILHYKAWGDSNDVSVSESLKNRINSCNSKTGNAINPVLSALFLIGELSMVGFSVEEDSNDTSIKLVIPEGTVQLVQLLMSSTLPVNNMVCDDVIRAHAFLTIGKLCLRDRNRARDMINVFLREIHRSDNGTSTSSGSSAQGAAAVRSNALLVLGDLCVRYTSLVERHIGAIASCLQDPEVLVRKHAIVLLTQLLLQDFLKWRGMLLFRFLATPIDHDSDMSQLAKTILKSTLKTKYPGLFAQHFSEAVIVFNGYMHHPAYIAASCNGSDGDSCSVTMEGVNLEGQNKRNKRLKLYAMMMEDLTEEQKVGVTAKLVQDILSHAVDCLHSSASESLTSSKEFESCLDDTLLILQSPMLKVGNRKAIDDGDDDDAEGTDASISEAKSKVLQKLSSQHLIGHILPVVMSLKSGLESVRSPLQKSVMEYLVFLVKTHKTEINQVLSTDPALKAEIEYDLKIFEKAKQDKVIADRVLEATSGTEILGLSPVNQKDSCASNSSGKSIRKSLTAARGSISSPVLKSALCSKDKGSNSGYIGRVSMGRTPKQSLTCVNSSDNLADRLLGDAALEGTNAFGNATDDTVGSCNSNSNNKRRHWSVVVSMSSENSSDAVDVDSITDENLHKENSTVPSGDDLAGDGEDIFSPLKKKLSKNVAKPDDTVTSTKHITRQIIDNI